MFQRRKNSFKGIILSLVFLLAFSAFAGFAGANTKQDAAKAYGDFNFSSSKKTSVIVELNEPSIIEAKHKGQKQSKQNLKKVRDNVKANVQKVAKNANVNREYDHVFSGFSVEVKESDIPELLKVPGVKAIYPNVEYTVDTVGEGIEIDALEISPEMMDSAPFIGSDKAWAEGFTGEGITVAILDTGVDYKHPDLEDNFGDYKGWDFVDNNDSPQETPVGDPRGGSTNHGTHVAGTVAANGAIKGVAPEATLLSYRVLGPGGRGTTENVIAGIERAVQDGADIMNLSLGNTLNSPDFATSLALDWAMAEGVVAVTSNGNSGPHNWTVGSPGTSREAISVGATQLPYDLYRSELFTSEGVEYPSAKVMGYSDVEKLKALNGQELEFVDVGLGAVKDFEGKDLKGKIALISRGDFAFVDKATNAKAAGAAGIIMYNNVAGEMPDVPGLALPTIKLDDVDGKNFVKEFSAGNNTVLFTVKFDKVVGETVANFSSRGPVMDTWMIKPDVSAPGVAIVSTVPTHNSANPHGYASLQGTSMAAPHVAGAAALILQANPNWSVDFVKASLMNTAENLYDINEKLYPHNTQGAGSIRVVDAIHADTLITPGSHSFGVFLNGEETEVKAQQFTINNLSKDRKRYSFDVKFNEKGIKVTTSRNLVVQPNRSQDVNFNAHVDASKLAPGYYEGTITVSDGTKTYEVPTILFVGEPDYPRANQ
ncbi:S8 family serine peptidase [Alkalihalobacterium elongatum]|uniref:S8 family serine peptidase n=1 Tax=Alkalihalobacterium elongatum TaxID=2675466 RepID=UPI001C1F3805|nr:S8 family serine peptidase [Alkalihalobacterium elongatum]